MIASLDTKSTAIMADGLKTGDWEDATKGYAKWLLNLASARWSNMTLDVEDCTPSKEAVKNIANQLCPSGMFPILAPSGIRQEWIRWNGCQDALLEVRIGTRQR